LAYVFYALRRRISKSMKLKLFALFAVIMIVVSIWFRSETKSTAQAIAPAPTRATVSKQPEPITEQASRPADLREWIAVNRAYGTAPSVDQVALGIQLATERRAEMRRLMRENPAEAMARSLSWSEWVALPEAIRALIEKPFSETIDFRVLPSCPPLEGAVNNIHPHRVVIGEQEYEAFVYGSNAAMTSKEGMPARGILLDGMAVLADERFERLEGENLGAAKELFGRGAREGVSWVSGKPVGVDGRTILLGGTIYDVASDAEESELAEVLTAAQKSFHPKSMAMALQAGVAASGTIAFEEAGKKAVLVANSTWTETSKKTLAVRISYASAPTSYSYTLTQLTNLLVATSNHVKTISYRKTWLVPTYATVNLPNDQAYYEANGPDAVVNDTRTALTAQGINRDNYDMVVHAHPQTGGSRFGYAGLGYIGGGISWINGSVDANVLTHEIGHNYGLGHAHFWAGVTGMGSLGRTGNTGAQVEHDEYGDPFDVMGSSQLPAGQYGAHGKAALNWIEPKEVINVVTNGIYRVFRFDHVEARTNSNAKLALKVTCPGGEEYWISHRRLFSANATMSRGAYIVRANGSGDQSLIDATQLSRLGAFGGDRDDAALVVGKSFADSVGTVRITTIGTGGTAPLEYLDVQVAFTPDTGSYSFFADANLATNGLVGSYVNADLRSRAAQEDWRVTAGVTIAGKRIDPKLSFTSNGWGARAPLKLTSGTDANWDTFSVQWDGYIVVRRAIRLATISDDSSRFWIDLNKNGTFAATAPEFVNNHWGSGQGATMGDLSSIVPPGTYRIRIQYEEGNGDNSFTMTGAELPFQLFTTAARTTPGLTGSYVARSLRASPTQVDWRNSQTIAGARVDEYPVFKVNGWGTLADVGLTDGVNGADADWNDFSVQWDGFITNSVLLKLATISDDGSRIWIDVNTNGVFGTTSPEFFNNGWGNGQGATLGAVSGVLQPGMYAIRIQYEEGGGDDSFVLAGAPQFPIDAPVLYSALVFTGSEHLTTVRKVAGDFTIEFWLRTTQASGDHTDWRIGAVLADAGDFGVSLGAGEVLFGAKDMTIRSPFVADGAWHYVSARRVQSSGRMDLFVDGEPVATGVGVTDLLNSSANIEIGAAADGSRGYVGNLDQVKIWDTARTSEQMMADLHLSRSGHMVDTNPEVRIAQLQPNSVQVFWDALSSWRILEGASSVSGPFTTLSTDQNSTNIIQGANAMRFFRVRK
jgi:hypothetical protein